MRGSITTLYARFILQRPLFVLAALAALLIGLATQTTNFKLDASADSLLLEQVDNGLLQISAGSSFDGGTGSDTLTTRIDLSNFSTATFSAAPGGSVPGTRTSTLRFGPNNQLYASRASNSTTDFALSGLAVADHATAGADDRNSQSIQDWTQVFRFTVNPPTRFAHASDPLDHAFAVGAVFEVNTKLGCRVVFDFLPVPDIAFAF